MSETEEIYIGDGCYVSFDGWMYWLRAPRENGDHLVGLETPVFDALIAFRKSVENTVVDKRGRPVEPRS